MFGLGLLSILSSICTAKEYSKEKAEKPAPKGTRFDWDAYYKDIENGINVMDQVHKCERGEYYTTKPADPKWWELPIDTVVDVERYEHDRKTYGEDLANMYKKIGSYRQIRKF
jgi:hypothetical protein